MQREIIEYHLKRQNRAQNTRIVDVVGGVPLVAAVEILDGAAKYLGIHNKRC